MEYYSRKSGTEKELLVSHLKKASELCERYMSSFGMPVTGRVIGRMHDIGKHTLKFQDVLFGNRTKVNHAIVGSQRLAEYFSRYWSDILHIIASHHYGLHKDWNYNPNFNNPLSLIDVENKENALSNSKEFNEIKNWLQQEKLDITIYEARAMLLEYKDIMGKSQNEKMFINRMIFSCLVDADYSSSATFGNNSYLDKYEAAPLNPDDLLQKLNNYRFNLIASSTSNNQLNTLRNKVFADCSNAGKTNYGNYTLTAPTGTAKTLATLNFALENARATNKKRIIFVLPYLSIIEQNAKIYRDICGDDIVLEDDSQTIFTDKTKVFSERWSSPIIVTTSVKFFETLFAREGVDLRKLHNIADSVVIFDESQTIPNNILDASLEVLNVLNNKFNVTTLFSTATPPSFQYRKNAYWKAHEVIQNPQQLFDEYAKIKNLKINWMIDKPISDLELFDLVKNKSSYLVIFNLKKHANDFYNMLKNEIGTDGLFYISTNLCSAHRTKVLQKIKQRLDKNLPTKVISTQCLEAGVDIDFQYVLRAFGPATSIAQAAGRCSRNALFPGELTIFIPSGQRIYPDGNYSNASEQLKTQIRVEGNFDICNLANIDSYYHRLFNTLGMDKDDRELTSSIAAFSYEDVEKNYKLIPNQGVTIIVPYSGCQSEYDALKQELVDNNYCITKAMMKKAQFFTVTLYNKKETKTYCTELYINMGDSLVECGWYLLDDSLGYYDENVGLNFSSDNQFIF